MCALSINSKVLNFLTYNDADEGASPKHYEPYMHRAVQAAIICKFRCSIVGDTVLHTFVSYQEFFNIMLII